MKKLCDRCGCNSPAMTSVGSAILCPVCRVDIQEDIDTLRGAKKPVNVLQIARKHFKTNYSGGDYLLREIPTEIKQMWKETAAKARCTERDIALAALVQYLTPA